MESTTPRRPTRTQLYKFVRQNEGNLFLEIDSRFDGMVDCVMPCTPGFDKVLQHKEWDLHTMGIGAWCVGGGRDHITPYESAVFTGYRVTNSCGSFTVAVRKIAASEL